MQLWCTIRMDTDSPMEGGGLPPPRKAKEGGRPRRKDGSSNSGRRCFNCGKPGHLSKDCELPPGNTACYLCGMEGHKSAECPQKAVQN